MNRHIHEGCGLFGIYDKSDKEVVPDCYYGLFALQHRGQESCGIAVNDQGVIRCHKDVGLVNDVFTPETLASLGKGSMAMGHVRYSTAGAQRRSNAQPLLVNHIKGSMALAHNGALTNAFELREQLELQGAIFHTTSDTEVISYIITQERLRCPTIESAVSSAMNRIQGAYSLIVMSPTKLIAARDPQGFRPLCLGRTNNGYVFASETCALDSVGATFLRDLRPGEILVVDRYGLHVLSDHCDQAKKTTCVFEYIYFARPDSVIDGSSVHTARLRAGAFLALEHPVQADVVIGVPDSGISAAIGFANQSGIPYGMGFIKNKYIGRTFIEPGQAHREDRVRIKLNPVAETVRGKRVVLIDDSIVRGTTSARIVRLLREAGAKEVHMRVSSPPFLFPCYFGTDVDSQENLIACKHSIEEIKKIIRVDSLGFLSCESVRKIADKTRGFCDACFTGEYPVEPPQRCGKFRFEVKIGEEQS